MKIWRLSLLFLFGAIAPLFSQPFAVASLFDSDLEGWTKGLGSDPGSSVSWISTGGNPGGFLRLNEAAQGAFDNIAAPASFLGNKSSFIGGTLSLDRLTNTLTSPSNRNDDVRLTGGGLALRYDLPNPGLGEWIREEIPLAADAGWVRISDGIAPTSTQFSSVMADLTGLFLLADFRSGAETPSFDNIILTVPEPSSAAAITGIFTMFWILRRRQRV